MERSRSRVESSAGFENHRQGFVQARIDGRDCSRAARRRPHRRQKRGGQSESCFRKTPDGIAVHDHGRTVEKTLRKISRVRTFPGKGNRKRDIRRSVSVVHRKSKMSSLYPLV